MQVGDKVIIIDTTFNSFRLGDTGSILSIEPRKWLLVEANGRKQTLHSSQVRVIEEIDYELYI